MNKQEMKAQLDEAIKNDNKRVIIKILDPLIEDLALRINRGVLIKNIKRHLEHGGIKGKCADMVTEIAQIRAERFMSYKAK